MIDRSVVKRILTNDGKHELQIFCREDGKFGYVGSSEFTEGGHTFWTPTEFSGIYESLELAEAAARMEVSWLRS